MNRSSNMYFAIAVLTLSAMAVSAQEKMPELAQNLNAPPPAAMDIRPDTQSGSTMVVKPINAPAELATKPILKAGVIYDVSGNRANGGKFHLLIEVERIDGQAIKATIQAFNQNGQCNAKYPINGVIGGDGTVVMESRGEGVLLGCERKLRFIAKAPEQLEGDLIGANGNFFKVSMVPK